MSILAKNLRVLRKTLKCTQSAMADVLKVGFRTYVRYEAGERDAPVSTLIKMARLGNLSLEKLLTEELTELDVLPIKNFSAPSQIPDVKRVDFQSGQISFSNLPVQGLIPLDDSEYKLISIFRKLDFATQEELLENLGGILKNPGRTLGRPRGVSKSGTKSIPEKSSKKMGQDNEKVIDQVPKSNLKNRTESKNVDKKILQDKVRRLKMIARSVNKITVS